MTSRRFHIASSLIDPLSAACHPVLNDSHKALLMSDKPPSDDTTAIAHDIRSPMNAVLGLADLLAMSRPLTDRQANFIRTLKLSAEALNAQINQWLGAHEPPDLTRNNDAPPAPAGSPARPRVLLVDDYPPNVLVVATYLEKFGYDYDIADNGIAAIGLAKRNQYVACLMDVQMHDMDGIEATMAIRDFEAQARKPHLPIIGVTAHALSGDRERCLDAGMDEYVAKPFNPSDLETRLAALIAA